MKDLLLHLCSYPFTENNRETLAKLLAKVEDWAKVVELINAHGIIALAAYNILEAKLEKEIPETAFLTLENGYRQNIIRNIWLTARWKEVNDILLNAGIKYILLKGMALEYTIYGSRGLRQMNDNDILINRDQAADAWNILQREGFTYNTPKSPVHLKIMKDISHHLPTLYKNGYAIEIHTHLFGYGTYLQDNLPDPFTNPMLINISGTAAFIPDKVTNLEYLVDHFDRHALGGESQLRSYSDIILLSGNRLTDFNDKFILNPDQRKIPEFRKTAYRTTLKYMQPKYRFLYIIGDLFPSIKWMKERYKCSGLKSLLYYFHRIGKLFWLFR